MDCLSSSREKIISFFGLNFLRIVSTNKLPKEPVPPVIRIVFPLSIIGYILNNFKQSSALCKNRFLQYFFYQILKLSTCYSCSSSFFNSSYSFIFLFIKLIVSLVLSEIPLGVKTYLRYSILFFCLPARTYHSVRAGCLLFI